MTRKEKAMLLDGRLPTGQVAKNKFREMYGMVRFFMRKPSSRRFYVFPEFSTEIKAAIVAASNMVGKDHISNRSHFFSLADRERFEKWINS